jgi:transglutaminase-like putative cysteine protease
MDIYLRPTPTIDCDSAAIKEKARQLVGEEQETPQKAKNLFYFVRDEIRYNIFVPSDKPEYFRASRILEVGEGFCIQKALLFIALARATGIPACLHLAAIQNHLAPEAIIKLFNGNVFPTHGYCGLYVDGKWLRVAPTFNLKICQRNGLIPVEFDGRHDALLPPQNQEGLPYIEYVEDRGYYDDLPFDKVMSWRLEALGGDFFERIKQAIELRNSEQSR